MTIKVWNRRSSNPSPKVIAEKGVECCIDVSIGQSRSFYGDSITIKTHEGTVKINGNHVHELMKSILRFSNKEMLECWISFALITNKAAGRKEIDLTTDLYQLDEWKVEQEKDSRDREQTWNKNYFDRKATA